MADPTMTTLLSSKGPEHEAQEEVMPLSEYKFNCSKLVVIKRTPKRNKALMGGVKRHWSKVMMKSVYGTFQA